MATLYAYLADGGEVEDGVNGFRETVTYVVHGLTGPKETWLDQSLQASGLPARYQAHPSRFGAVVTQRVGRPDGPSSVRISITYSVIRGTEIEQPADGSDGVIEVGATVATDIVSRDARGDPIFVIYDKPVTNLLGDDVIVEDVQGREIERQTAQVVLRRTRTESAPPVSKARRFVGSVNRFSIWGFGAESLLCTGITGRSADNGATYEVEYEFQFRPEGWQVEVVYIDNETNAPPLNLIDGRGRKFVTIQREENFGSIGVSF